MPVRWAIASGNYSSTATWNDGATLGIPTTGDDVYANNFTVNMDVNATVNSLNNSARARDIATPAMTANNAPSPYVAAASTILGAAQDAWVAFNRVTTPSTNWSSTAVPAWLSMDFGSGSSIVIDAYTIFAGNDANNPRNWTFEGSDNNSTWTTLHTVTLPSAIAANSSYSSGNIGNITGYRYYRINVSLSGGSVVRISELELYQQGTAALASGGSFNFNTAGVTVTCTSTSASLSAGATNLITVTATTGTVTLNVSSSVTGLSTAPTNLINHTGNCNFNLSGQNFTAGPVNNATCINKPSLGTITVNGNIFGGTGAGVGGIGINNTNGNVVIIGNVIGGAAAAAIGVGQNVGNLTITGNISAGTGAVAVSHTAVSGVLIVNGNATGGTAAGLHGINFTGASGTITGNILGGRNATAYGVNATGALVVNGNVTGDTGNGILTTTTLTVTGTVQGGPVAAIASTSANTINVTGDVYASATANGISSTNANGVVNLTGNMYNGLGRNAIYCQNVFISNTSTTLWRVDTGGGDYKFLYSADTTPNLPATTNVRSGVTFGPALSLTGTMVVPAASDVRENVAVDNTVGTGELTSADIISGINASADPLAVRLKNALTDVTAGNIISQYKDS